MTTQELQIVNSNLSKAEKARRLYDLGFTRHQVAELICSGNYGWAHNIYKKHFGLETIHRTIVAGFAHKFGVEIEAYNVDMRLLERKLNEAGINASYESYNHNTRSHWKIVSDASLSGNESFELVSPVLVGEDGMNQVKKVCDILSQCNAKVNKSCGMHVHFDARNLSLNDWKNLYKNYATIETQIDAIMPASRRGNQYCKSLKNGFGSLASLFEKIDAASSIQSIARNVANNDRYFKMNVQSFLRHGTVEFRQHSGTVEFEKMNNWIRICGALIDKSHTALVNNLQDFIPQDLMIYVNNRKRKFAA